MCKQRVLRLQENSIILLFAVVQKVDRATGCSAVVDKLTDRGGSSIVSLKSVEKNYFSPRKSPSPF